MLNASRLDKIREVGLWSVAVIATVAFLPFPTPSSFVPLKQFAAGTIGVLLGIVSLSRLRLNWPILRTAKERYLTVWAAGAFGWIAWAMVRTLASPRATWYESYWGSSDRGAGLLTQLGFVGLAIAGVTLARRVSARKYVWCFAIVLWVVLLYNIGQHYGFDFVQWQTDPKYIATLGNMNQASSFYAAATVLLGIASWNQWSETRRVDRALLCWGLGSGMALGMCLRTMMAGSRQGIFLVAVTATVFVLASTRWRVGQNGTGIGFRKWASLGVVAMAACAVAYTLRDHGVGDRFRIWSTALAIWWDQPLAGAGIGQVRWVWYQHATSAELQSGILFRLIDQVHSGPLQQAAELGLPGLVSYAGMLLVPTVVAIKRMQDGAGLTRAVAALWLVFVVQDIFSPATLGLSSWGAIAIGILLQLDGGVEESPWTRKTLTGWRTSIALVVAAIVLTLSLQRFRTELLVVRAWNKAAILNAASADVRRQLTYLSARPGMVRAVALRPFDTSLATMTSITAARNGDPATARMIATASLQNEPRNLQLRDLLGQIATAAGSYDSAAVQYAHAARTAPRSIAIALLWDLSAKRTGVPQAQLAARTHLDSLVARQYVSASQLAEWRVGLENGATEGKILYRAYGQSVTVPPR